MEIIVSGRHLLEVDDDIRAYTEGKMSKLAAEYPKLTSARVVMDVERGWCIAEGHVYGKHLSLDASARTRDVLIAVDSMTEKLEKQLRRYLEKVQSHHARKDLVDELEAAPELEPDAEDDLVDEVEPQDVIG